MLISNGVKRKKPVGRKVCIKKPGLMSPGFRIRFNFLLEEIGQAVNIKKQWFKTKLQPPLTPPFLRRGLFGVLYYIYH